MQLTRVCVLFLCAAALAATARAQVMLPEKGGERVVRENIFGLGLAGGPATGIGLSFRHHLPGSWSYEFTGGIIKVDDKTSYAVGGEIQFDLVRAAATRFFVAGGMGYYYGGRGHGNTLDGPVRVGLGVGGEVPMASGFHVSGELLFTYFSDATVLPLPQIGVYYYFY